MKTPKTRAEINRELALRLRREAVELKSSPQPRFVRWVIEKYLALATRAISAADANRDHEDREGSEISIASGLGASVETKRQIKNDEAHSHPVATAAGRDARISQTSESPIAE